MVVPAEDVRDPHRVIVHDGGEIIGRMLIGAEDHEIVQGPVLEGHGAPHLVLPRGLPLRHEEPDRVRLALGGPGIGLLLREPETGAVVLGGLAAGERLLASALQILRVAEAAIRLDLVQEAPRRLGVTLESLALEIRPVRSSHHRPLVPAKPQPGEPLEDSIQGALHVPVLIGVLDAQHEDAAVSPRVEVVEERGAGAPDVEISGRARRESHAYRQRHPGPFGGVGSRCAAQRSSTIFRAKVAGPIAAR